VRSRPELAKLALCLLLGAGTVAMAATSEPTPAQIERAAAAVKADPNLATEATVRRLDWDAPRQKPHRKKSDWLRWFSWVGDLFAWIGEISQMLMWLVIAALIAGLGVLLLRVFQGGRRPRSGKSFVAPTHVQDLDIRPESLPEDIGATARALWDRGEQRAALALLYRGLLSRLAHVYEVPIRDSSTEGDCLSIAARTLEARRLEYATRLVRTWQRAIYGGLSIEDAVVHELCANFDACLERPAAAEKPRRTPFAREAAA
jgi:hypothetical protein